MPTSDEITRRRWGRPLVGVVDIVALVPRQISVDGEDELLAIDRDDSGGGAGHPDYVSLFDDIVVAITQAGSEATRAIDGDIPA